MGGAAGAGQVEDFVAFESGFFAPAPEVRTAKIEAVAWRNYFRDQLTKATPEAM